MMMPLWQASEDGTETLKQHHGFVRSSQDEKPRMSTSSAPAATDHSFPEKKANWYASLTPSQKQKTMRRKSFDPEQALPTVESHRPLKPARSPPETTVFDYFPILLIFKWFWKTTKRMVTLGRSKIGDGQEEAAANHRNFLGRKRKPALGDSNVPLEIILYLET